MCDRGPYATFFFFVFMPLVFAPLQNQRHSNYCKHIASWTRPLTPPFKTLQTRVCPRTARDSSSQYKTCTRAPLHCTRFRPSTILLYPPPFRSPARRLPLQFPSRLTMPEEEIGDHVVPKEVAQSKLKACMSCSLIKTTQQFVVDGCDNCPFMSYRNDRERVFACTTSQFVGYAFANLKKQTCPVPVGGKGAALSSEAD